jgi:hypothetical protein
MAIHLARSLWMAAPLLLAACGPRQEPVAAPVPAVHPSATLMEPRCEPAPRPEGQPGVRFDCAGADDLSRAVRFSVELPVGWEHGEHEGRDVMLMATRGWSVIVAQAGDMLADPRTAADSADYWQLAAELLLERTPTPAEADSLRRRAGDAGGMRLLLTRAQQADSALLELAGHLSAAREGITVVSHERSLRSWAGGPAGHLHEVTRRDGRLFHSLGYVTVRDGVFYGLVFTAREDAVEADTGRWERVQASFAIHPRRR